MNIDGLAQIATSSSPFFRVTSVTLDGAVLCTQFSGSYAEDISRKHFDAQLNDVTVAFCCFVQFGGGQQTFVKAAHMREYDPKTGDWNLDT